MARTIVETDTKGWYFDPETQKKTRKQDDDEVLTQEQFTSQMLGNGSSPASTQSMQVDAAQHAEAKAQGNGEPETATVADTGKVLRGKTEIVRCKHKVKNSKGKLVNCGAERVVKVQDVFQVKRCVPHQEEHRRDIRKQKAKARRAEAKAAAKS